MRNSLSLLSILLLASCSGRHYDRTVQSQKPNKDTVVDSENQLDPDQAQVRKEFIASDSTITIDTSWIANGETYSLHFEHGKNSKNLTIPAKYNFDTNEDFTTHESESHLTLMLGKDTLFKKQIKKEIFVSLLDSTQRKYATLLYPHLVLKNDSVEIHYSITIPVTDVGLGVEISFDKSGHYTTK